MMPQKQIEICCGANGGGPGCGNSPNDIGCEGPKLLVERDGLLVDPETGSEETKTPIEKLGSRLAELRDEKSRINERLKEVNEMETSLEARMIELLAQIGISNAVVPSLGKRFIVATKSHYSMPTKETPAARREVIRWVENHNPDMVTVNAQTFGKFVRELAEAGEKIPPEIKVFRRPELRMESV